MLADERGNMEIWDDQKLKYMISSKKVKVINLTLTSDNRLVMASPAAVVTSLGVHKPERWTKVHKSSYTVYVCKPPIGTPVYNVLEDAHYVTNEKSPYILSGTAGEQWVVKESSLQKTYMQMDGSPIPSVPDNNTLDWTQIQTRPDATPNWVFFLDINLVQNYPVKTDWAILYANSPVSAHGKGDYLMCSDNNGSPNFGDMWVVNGEIFGKTYTTDFSTPDGNTKFTAVSQRPSGIRGNK
jgi:hypothetical protein